MCMQREYDLHGRVYIVIADDEESKDKLEKEVAMKRYCGYYTLLVAAALDAERGRAPSLYAAVCSWPSSYLIPLRGNIPHFPIICLGRLGWNKIPNAYSK